MKRHWLAVFACFVISLVHADDSGVVTVADSMFHLRVAAEREWADFPNEPPAATFQRRFNSEANLTPWTLSLRQQDVKQAWDVRLNDKSLGRLVRDENDLRTDFKIPIGGIVQGQNRLEIRQTGRQDSDDIRVGQIELHQVAPHTLRNMATIQVALTDELDAPLAGRITVVNQAGTLMPVGARSGDGLAVREGVVYSATGTATFGVEPGVYRIFGGRGFEYSTGSTRVRIEEGQRAKRTFQLIRQVDTHGWVACDTHVHTVTHSGHGDCTIEERMVTLAGEGIELPIATDHNKHIDYQPAAISAGVASQFTAVIGNEVTTKQGHFNIFPVQAGAEIPDHTQNDWGPLMDDVFATPDVRVAILNHARDVHGGFRPFSPRHHISLTGENLDDWPQRFNAMEVINSGAVQTDSMELFGDWCGLVNRGLQVTPVGSSDSHDVARYIVGQGRTYIQCDDADVGAINVDAAVESFLQGRVVVSYGLFTRLIVNQAHGPGDLVKLAGTDDEIVVTAEVLGPDWTRCERIELFVNGIAMFRHEDRHPADDGSSMKSSVTWRIPRSQLGHDVWITAVATGPGLKAPFWATAKPYQPDSPRFESRLFSSTGPIRIDVDGDGEFSSPLEYANDIVSDCGPDLEQLLARLQACDASVTHQAMSLLRAGSTDLSRLQGSASGQVRTAIADYQRAWQESVRSSLEQTE